MYFFALPFGIILAIHSAMIQCQLDPVENCKTFSACYIEAEGYFQQYASLFTQKLKMNPPVLNTEYDKCTERVRQKQFELSSLDSERRLYIATCMEDPTATAFATVDSTQKAKYETLMKAYTNSTVNQTSPTEAVQLPTCKCDQDPMINNYNSLCSKKRTMCDTLAPICSIYTPTCNSYKLNLDRSNVTNQIGKVNWELMQMKQECANMITTTTRTPTTPIPQTKSN